MGRDRSLTVRRALLLTALLLGACSSADPFSPLPEPDPASLDGADAPAPPRSVPLRRVEGTTTTAPPAVRGGGAGLTGRVSGPEGPVAGAVIRLERLAGDAVAALQVASASDGSWSAVGIAGGRYRVRAWSPPLLAMAEPEVLFLETGPPRPLDLLLARLGGVRLQAVVAPDPPSVGDPVNLRVRVSSSTVDGGGVVRAVRVAGTSVALTGSGSWELLTPSPAPTDANGDATFGLVCRGAGDQPLRAVAAGVDVDLELAPCR